MDDELRVEPTGSNDYGPCECCGNMSRRVWGFIHTTDGPLATYFVHWTPGRVDDHGANFDLIVGKWGPQATAGDRRLVALAYRLFETGPEFMVIDGPDRPTAASELVGRALRRAEVVGRPIATVAFGLVDAILKHDGRVLELLGDYRMT